MSEYLFEDFNKISAQEWKQKIQLDLKGADYNKSLIWNSLEGIDVKPFYHSEETNSRPLLIPHSPQTWNIATELFIDNESITNRLALNTIERGANALVFTADKEFSIMEVFQDLPIRDISIYFQLNFLSEEFIIELNQYLSDKRALVFYRIDIIGNLVRTGNWYRNLKEDHTTLENIINYIPDRNVLGVDMSIYQNAGANMIQQIAYGLAHVNEYFNHFCSDEKSCKSIKATFTLAVGSNYFFEIAKIRALRILYGKLASEYDIPKECHIIATPTKRNKTLYDYNVNLLRTTTEYMSAVLGGANTVCSLPYDVIYHKRNEFGERIARNQLLILRSESYFNFDDDPVTGTYYIENLTKQISEKALVLFKDIENNGGFLRQLKEGTIQRKIKESSEKEQQLFNSGELALLGTNIHINKNDRMKDDLELFPFLKKRNNKTLIVPILEKRLTENIEQERLNNE